MMKSHKHTSSNTGTRNHQIEVGQGLIINKNQKEYKSFLTPKYQKIVKKMNKKLPYLIIEGKKQKQKEINYSQQNQIKIEKKRSIKAQETQNNLEQEQQDIDQIEENLKLERKQKVQQFLKNNPPLVYKNKKIKNALERVKQKLNIHTQGQNFQQKMLKFLYQSMQMAKNFILCRRKIQLDSKYKKKQKKCCMIYPSNEMKMNWDLFMALVLIYSCTTTPIKIAFSYTDGNFALQVSDYIIDGLFLMDSIFNFFTATEDEDLKVLDDRYQIIKNYLFGWFTFDILSIFPFDIILSGSGYGNLSKFIRIGRLYRLVRLTKLVKILYNLRQKSKFLKRMIERMKISKNTENLAIFLCVFFIFTHLVTCIWIIIANSLASDSEGTGTWMESYMGNGQLADGDLYVLSLYWTIQTITTVGYGDVLTQQTIERLFAVIILVIGVLSFSLAQSLLTTIIAEMDQQKEIEKEKMDIITYIRKQYKVPKKFFVECKNIVQQNVNHELQEIQELIDEMPQKQNIQLTLYINEDRYKNIKFMHDKTLSFISWITSLMKPLTFNKSKFVFKESEEITAIYFSMSDQTCSYVLPKFNNISYIQIQKGDQFGLVDIFACSKEHEFEITEFQQNKQHLKRFFSVMAVKETDTLSLNLEDVIKIKKSFVQYYGHLLMGLDKNLKHSFILKERALKACLEQRKQHKIEEKKKNEINLRNVRKERKYKIKEIMLTELDEITLNGSKDGQSDCEYSSSSFSAFSDTDSYDEDSVLDEKNENDDQSDQNQNNIIQQINIKRVNPSSYQLEQIQRILYILEDAQKNNEETKLKLIVKLFKPISKLPPKDQPKNKFQQILNKYRVDNVTDDKNETFAKKLEKAYQEGEKKRLKEENERFLRLNQENQLFSDQSQNEYEIQSLKDKYQNPQRDIDYIDSSLLKQEINEINKQFFLRIHQIKYKMEQTAKQQEALLKYYMIDQSEIQKFDLDRNNEQLKKLEMMNNIFEKDIKNAILKQQEKQKKDLQNHRQNLVNMFNQQQKRIQETLEQKFKQLEGQYHIHQNQVQQIRKSFKEDHNNESGKLN